ncbi:putative uncharacterized protein flj45035 [Phtheirospermum japonicum]|uniref:RNase H type-1 domain-containing protein n=1 Tax=Phtheirospermum japonicum TaxID=374723 RepID=A0A830CDH3_9LAMI|nr:putative uncharacterized protein flj45035 [Phtheirospermum japonicum]
MASLFRFMISIIFHAKSTLTSHSQPKSAFASHSPPKSAFAALSEPKSASAALSPPKSASAALSPPKSASAALSPPKSAFAEQSAPAFVSESLSRAPIVSQSASRAPEKSRSPSTALSRLASTRIFRAPSRSGFRKPYPAKPYAVGQRSLVTYPVKQHCCHLCPFITQSKKQLINHYKDQHSCIFDNVKHRVRICRCGACFKTDTEYDNHVSKCLLMNFQKPKPGFMKLSIDACSMDDKGSGAGGLIRNDSGRPLVLFAEPLGICLPLLGELRSLERGLSVTCQTKARIISVDSDSQQLVWAISKRLSKPISSDVLGHILDRKGNPVYRHLLLRVREMLSQEDYVFEVNHVYRQANKVADALADIGYSEREFKIFGPNELKEYPLIEKLLEEDETVDGIIEDS